jgi:hypothetical protein
LRVDGLAVTFLLYPSPINSAISDDWRPVPVLTPSPPELNFKQFGR